MAGLEEPLIPQYSNQGVDNFVKGFALVAENNRKKIQNEIAFEHMKNQAAEDTLKNDLSLKREQDRSQHWADMYSLGEKANEIRSTALDNKVTLAKIQQNQDKVTDDRITEFAGKAFTLDKPGSQGFDTEWNSLKSQYSDLAGEKGFNDVARQVEARHAAAAKQSAQAKGNLQLDYNRAIAGVGVTAGVPPAVVHNYFANPNMWNLKGGKAYIDIDANGQPLAQNDPKYKEKYKTSFTIDRSIYEGIQKKRDAAYAASQVHDAPAMKIDDETGQKIADQISANHPDWTPAQKRDEWNRQTSGYSQ